MVLPTENIEPLGELDADQIVRWAALSVPLVPFGGLLSVGLQAEETLLVVGILGGEDLALAYPWLMGKDVTVRGRWTYPREAVGRLVSSAGKCPRPQRGLAEDLAADLNGVVIILEGGSLLPKMIMRRDHDHC